MPDAPRILIVLEYEATPRVLICADSDGQEARLLEWIAANPDLADLVDRACDAATARQT